MLPILLIAGNVVREQRWPVVFLVLWCLLIAVAVGEEELIQGDFVVLMGQQALYAVGFSAFAAAFSLHNERRSRRILLVLARALRRRHYLAGVLLGVWLCSSVYCAAIGASTLWITRQLAFAPIQAAELVGVMVVACWLTAAIGLFFSTFLDPFPATAATTLLISAPVALGWLLGDAWMHLLPVYSLTSPVTRFPFDPAWMPPGGVLAWAVVEAVGFWLAASWIFARRDVAVAVE